MPVAATASSSGGFVTSPEAILYAGTPTSSSSSTASTENGDEKNTRPRSSANAFSRRWSSCESSMRFVNSQRGSSKCGGVGVEGSISASAMCVWNLTASAPASAAASISRSAWRIEPSWLLPISAMTNDARAELSSGDLHGGHCSGGRPRIRRSRPPLLDARRSVFWSFRSSSRAIARSRSARARSLRSPASSFQLRAERWNAYSACSRSVA